MTADIRGKDGRPFSICVFCGSSSGTDPNMTIWAEELGMRVAKLGFRLVYGGGVNGIMGSVSSAAFKHGGEVLGITPHVFAKYLDSGETYGRHIVVDTMHERKALLESESDAFVAFPGGYGTLDEIFEAISWAQLNLHQKPLVFFNPNGFYDGIKTWIARAVAEGFVRESMGDLAVFPETVEGVLDAIRDYKIADDARYNLVWKRTTVATEL